MLKNPARATRAGRRSDGWRVGEREKGTDSRTRTRTTRRRGMLTQLSTVKARLGIEEFDVQYDGILTSAIKAVSARFDKECNRTLARTADAVEEFGAEERE